MGHWVRSLLELSPARAAFLLAQPWRLRVVFSQPAAVDGISALARLFPEVRRERIVSQRRDLIANHALFLTLDERMVEVRGRRTVCDEWKETLYGLVRLLRPAVMVETGVFDGVSSAIILQAMEDEGHGRLVSIDLPAVEPIPGSTHLLEEGALPPGRQPGWVIPDALRSRHTLKLGDARDLLPGTLQEHGTIDCFFHDSLHTLEHQLFEYRAAWPRLRPGGILLSDDIAWNAAFHTFCRETGSDYTRTAGGRLGMTRRPAAAAMPAAGAAPHAARGH